MTKKADMIIDLQYGSTGKGLIAGYLAIQNEYDVVVTANMPNAGHTFIDDKGNKMIHKVLPNGLVSPKCNFVMIGPGAVFSVDQLIKEHNEAKLLGYNNYEIIVHPNAIPLMDSHKAVESDFVKIGSTMQGSAGAMIHKIYRDPANNPTAKARWGEGSFKEFWVVSIDTYNAILEASDNILLEGAQGFSLGVNERFYPYCTSRDCTPARFLADMGVPVPMLRRVVGAMRVHPIRVGSPEGGYSGDVYPDQQETSWEELNLPVEYTTVTGRVRRVFTYSVKQIEDAIWATQPDDIFLNFCNYSNSMKIREIKDQLGNRLRYMGYGPQVNDIVEV